MAVPTFVSVTPAVGPTGGHGLVEILGTNFRLQTPPGPGFPVPEYVVPVSVKFGTADAEEVMVISATRLLVRPPTSPLLVLDPNDFEDKVYGEGAVDITIQNLDENGDPIGGESVVAAGAYTYQRPDLSKNGDLNRLCRMLTRQFRMEVLLNTTQSNHTDYDDDVGDLLDIIDFHELPGIALLGPRVTENRFYSLNEPVVVPGDNPNEHKTRRFPQTVDLGFALIGATDHRGQALNLLQAVLSMFGRTKFFYLERDPDDASKGKVKYEMDWEPGGMPSITSTPNNSNLSVISGRFEIRGFDMEDQASFPGELERGGSADVDDEGVRLDVDALP